MILTLSWLVYAIIAVFATITLANMNYEKRPSATNWVIGVFWLPVVFILLYTHWRYKSQR